MAMVQIVCPTCRQTAFKQAGAVNRSKRRNASVYCSRGCAGIARRKGKSLAQKKAEKRLYDIDYRRKNHLALKAKKAAHHRRTYDPIKAAAERKRRMRYHVAYCQRPEYRAWKKRYDRKHRAKKTYGSLWECQVLALDIRDEALARMSDYEIRLSKGTLNKCQKRKRDYEATYSSKP